MSKQTQKGSIDTEELLKKACARSAVLEIHRQQDGVLVPAAKARMIQLEDGAILLDEPQVIGREVPLGMGQTLDAYVYIDDELYTFQTVLDAINCPIKLNSTKSTRGARIRKPLKLTKGQRRQFFRTSLALIDPIPVTLHRTDPVNPLETPVTAHHFTGQLLDASPGGFGVRVDNVAYSRFKIFNHYFLSFRTPGQDDPTTLLCELRQTRAIRDGESVKIGFLTLPWPDQRSVDRMTQPLQRYLTEMQRLSRKAS